MTSNDPSEILMQGKEVWNAWRKTTPAGPTFASPNWYRGPGGRSVKGTNSLDFSDMNFSGVHIGYAFAEGLRLCNSVFEGTSFEEGDFSRANFSGATFRDAKFNETILTNAIFDDATFINCNLNRVNLVGASFRVKEITETVVYGIAAWDLTTSDNMKQSKLVIEQTDELYSDLIRQNKVPMMVDDIELAQFVHHLTSHKKMRNALNILTDKGVLLLGKFKDGGLERLDAMRERLSGRYLPMIFDFERSDGLSLTETVVTMAGLAKFIIADLTGSSVPHELASILGQIKRPVLAIGKPYTLLPDLADRTNIITIENEDAVESKLADMERLHAARIVELAQRYQRQEALPSN